MPEPFTSSSTAAGLAVVGGISGVSILGGIDGNLLVGAFAGAAVFVLRSQDMSLLKRVAYFAISILAGYIAAPEIMRFAPIQERGVAALIAAAAVVTLSNQCLDWLGKFNVGGFINRWKEPK
jgi:hypothetical protein